MTALCWYSTVSTFVPVSTVCVTAGTPTQQSSATVCVPIGAPLVTGSVCVAAGVGRFVCEVECARRRLGLAGGGARGGRRRPPRQREALQLLLLEELERQRHRAHLARAVATACTPADADAAASVCAPASK